MKKHIPNLITLGNLLCGTLATICAVEGDLISAGLFVVLGIIFDFFDGFAARLLNVSGELGKQLDSLADMVTSGVVPGVVMLQLLSEEPFNVHHFTEGFTIATFSPLLGLLLTLGACYRLAKFNIDTRQSESFIGLPTPAMSLFVISLPLILEYGTIEFVENIIRSNYFLIGVTVLLTYLMNAEIPLFSLKFKEYAIKKNLIKYLFLLTSLGMLLTLQFVSIPLIIAFYVCLSVVSNRRRTA
jgi:CDP-diacylglycerol--serine O-phosphatidyltransferase